MRNASSLAAALLLGCFRTAAGCSSGQQHNPAATPGFKVLDAVVTERRTETGPSGNLAYTLGFEAKDGDATVHMQYPVTRDQYMRYPEGTHVTLVLSGDTLREIRRGQ